jgi:aminoglycoside phosphotransferase (APT) family kinase protein
MLQAGISGDMALEDLLKSVLENPTPAAVEGLDAWMMKSAVGLASFHRSGADYGELLTWEERSLEAPKFVQRLEVPFPYIAGVVLPLLARLKWFSAAHPADPPVPTHGTFSPEQVLLDGDRVGFIDFDDYSMAEPAMDVGLFCASILDIGMNAMDPALAEDRAARLARLNQLNGFGEVFLAEYEKHAPVSRARVTLWQALEYLLGSLHYWTKVKPAEPDHALLMLEQHLHQMETIWSVRLVE